MKMTMNDIISKVVKYYASLPGDIEISTFEALEKVCKVDFDPDPKGEYLIDNIPMGFCELFNLNNRILEETEKFGMIVDLSNYNFMPQGLPYNIPHVIKKPPYYDEIKEKPISMDLHMKHIIGCSKLTHDIINQYLSSNQWNRKMLPWEHCAMSFQKMCFPMNRDSLQYGIHFCRYNDKPYYFGIGLDEPEVTDDMLENATWLVYTWSD